MSNNEQKGGHHIVSFDVLRNVAISLLILTALTVITSRFHLGVMAAPIAFLIAAIKAMLVMSFFMGLKYDVWINRVIFGLGFVGLGLLYLISIIDIFTRIPQHSTL
jgi:cytochrome c oxidase subunit 4